MLEEFGFPAERILHEAHQAFIVMDADGVVRGWSLAACELFGWHEDEAVGSRMSELIIPQRYRELHERGLQTYLRDGIGPVLGATIEIEGVHRSGRQVPVELTITPRRSSRGDAWFHAFLVDITHRRRIERLLLASSEVGWLVADAGRTVTVPGVLAAIGQAMQFEVGLAWMPDAATGRLRLDESWSSTPAGDTFVRESSPASFEPGVGLPGLVWQRGTPLWTADVASDERYVRRAQAAALDLHSGLFIPLVDGERVLGVLEFLSQEWQAATPDVLGRVAQLGARIGRHLPR